MVNKSINNKGFSLVEMLIVIAILAVMSSIAVFSFQTVNNANVSKAANRLEAALNKCRTECMTRGSDAGFLTLYNDSGTITYTVGSDTQRELICNSQIETGVIYGSNYADIGFADAGTGAFAVVSYNSAGMMLPSSFASGDLTKVSFANGNKRLQVILYKETGKTDASLY